MNKFFQIFGALFLFVFISTEINFAQHPFNKQYFGKASFGSGVQVGTQPFGYVIKATRFLPVFSYDGFDEWSSPGIDYRIGNESYNNFPLNYFSPDLIPFDIWQTGVNETDRQELNAAAENRMSFSLPKRDSSEIFFNSFFGSETGDPAIHVFTNENRRAVNRNKIPISGIIGTRGSFSNMVKYNISAGYFGAYSTGSINDFMLSSFDYYYFGKLNKQFLGSAGIDILTSSAGTLKINAGIVSYYGWDVAPFLASFTHFEIINSTLRAEYITPVNGLSISGKRDEGIGKINRTSITSPAEFYTRTYSVKPVYSFEAGAGELFTAAVSAEIEFLSAGNLSLDDGVAGHEFFTDQIEKRNYNFNFNSTYKAKIFDLNTGLIYRYHFSENKSLSGVITIDNFCLPGVRNFSVSLSSITKDANITEAFGKYTFEREIAGSIREFNIYGTEHVNTERVNRFSAAYNLLTESSKINLEIFYKTVENPIKQVPAEVVRISHERDLLRNSVYKNGFRKSGIGASLFFATQNFDFVNGVLNYNYLQNDDALYSPKNKFEASVILSLPFEAKLTFNWLYNSATVWQDFSVRPENDFYKGTGFDGEVDEISSFNLYFEYDFTSFYFLENLNVKMSFTNIFNRAMRFHPLGNRMDRAFLFSLSGKL
ncbi:MAG: hypothetical protein HND52_04455 [Ignavibacteriae bacterium]|nr:hypothetical protein [Ignavibacteriota bacterium]NOG97210.1 hypothetical protein [Ignavibacteriota bacterium]